MATIKCPNGHQYDSNIYHDKCPFCPSEENSTQVNPDPFDLGNKTKVNNTVGWSNEPTYGQTSTTKLMDEPEDGEGHTIIRHANPSGMTEMKGNNKKMIGLLISYDANPLGEVYKLYEGRNFIGRSSNCDIAFPHDGNISGKHLLILYREAEGVFWAEDQMSSNGTYVNGKFMGERTKLNTNDIIVIGATKLIFMAVPNI